MKLLQELTNINETLTLNPIVWAKEVLGYLRDLKTKSDLEDENVAYTALIDKVQHMETESDRDEIIKFAKKHRLMLPTRLKDFK